MTRGMGCGREASEEAHALFAGRLRHRGVGVHREGGVVRESERFVVEFEVADGGVVDAFRSAAVEADIMPCPSLPEAVAAGHELADQVGEGLVVRVLPGPGAE